MRRIVSETRIEGNVAYVALSNGLYAFVDVCDIPKVEGHRWYALRSRKTFYAKASVKSEHGKVGTIYMHRLISDAQRGMEVDHINMDGLDNRRENLRICTPSQNRCNIGLTKANTSGVKGVDRHKGKWRARIQVKGKKIELGSFDSIEDAASAYMAAAGEVHGEFSRLGERDATPAPREGQQCHKIRSR